jgi:hypothetical protein
MMRRPLTTLALVAMCGLLALVAGCAAGATGTKTASVAASRDPIAPATRTWTFTLSPAPDELSLAQIAFRGSAHGARVTSSSLRVAVSGPFGDDYLASAAVRLPGRPRALVLLVNRPSPLLDPVDVRIRVTARGTLGTPTVSRLSDPFTRAATAPRPSLCDLPLHGGALGVAQLSTLHARGEPLAAFAGASAVAQSYDAVCSLPFASSFEQDVTHSAAGSAPPETTPAPPVTTPSPPVGKLPGEGCVPAPGRACPGAVESRPQQ